MSALLDEAHALLAPMAQAKRLSLLLSVPDSAIVAPTDSGKFRQIVFNLTSNAIKCTATGTVELSLSRTSDEVQLRVRDTGPGVSAEDAEQLFVSFWQARAPGARTQGTGLGLAITRQLAQLLGGDVQLESSSAAGSTFLVRLPLGSRRSAAVVLPPGMVNENPRDRMGT